MNMSEQDANQNAVEILKQRWQEINKDVIKLIQTKPIGQQWVVFEDNSINKWCSANIYIDGIHITPDKMYGIDNQIFLKYPKDMELRIKIEIFPGKRPKGIKLIKYYLSQIKIIKH